MITVSTCGYDSNHKKPCNVMYNLTSDEYLVLLIKTDAWFNIEGQIVETKPNMMIIYSPKSFINYGREEIGYNDDWIHFSLNDDDSLFMKNLNIPLNQPLYPYDFHSLTAIVELMSKAYHKETPHTNEIVDHYMHLFLDEISDQLSAVPADTTPKYYLELSQIRTSIYNAPAKNWSVNTFAEDLFISVSHFQHLYKEFFDTSCQKDIIDARLRLAKFYLTTTDLSIKEIADICGYENELHFMRQFKKFIGRTPTEFRKSNIIATF
ncbi:MAG: AraC family transcriptional regulator [Butyrivibrio sp.]|uniref:helix-turn-helix domain-containing protein n=1 Tax=Butyrivibrio sp. TaxID=28121 RepID=UPI0025DC0890|nr:AraC family transcriptional regulator [Butyrivibrio sp.]MCR5770392.1 AraC family transcriptional regulator [Butyrivibrio sp.]